MYLFIDTETTNLPRDWKAPVTDLFNWPRLVQLAYLYYDDKGNKISEGNFIIKPDGFTIPLESSRVHGISTVKAMGEGLELQNVLGHFQDLIDKSEVLVANDMNFDEKVIGAEFLRNGFQDIVSSKNKISIRQTAANFCKIPGIFGFKWPRLSELHDKLFNTRFEETHNAFIDINATAKCFWELKRLGIV